MSRVGAVAIPLGVLIASLLAAGCGQQCHHLLDCPTGEVCSPGGTCTAEPPEQPPEPVTCVPGVDSAFLLSDSGYTVGASRWDCPPLRAMIEGSPTVNLTGFATAVNGGSMTLTAALSGAVAPGRWVYFGVVGDGMFAKQLGPNEVNGFPVELFLSSAALGGTPYLFMGIDDGNGSPEQPRPVNVARLRFNLIQVRGGDIQVSATWDNDNDVDLHVTAPDGEHIYFGNTSPRGEAYGQLDLDSSVGCVTGDPRNENIFFPVGTAIDGDYRVAVDLFTGCTATTNYRVTIVKNGALFDVVDGQLVEGDPSSRDHQVTLVPWP